MSSVGVSDPNFKSLKTSLRTLEDDLDPGIERENQVLFSSLPGSRGPPLPEHRGSGQNSPF